MFGEECAVLLRLGPISHFFYPTQKTQILRMAWDFKVWHFSYGPKCENAKMGQNRAIFIEKHAVYTKFWKYILILWPMCFLVYLVWRKKNKKKINHQHSSFVIFLSMAKTKKNKNNPKTTHWLKKWFKWPKAL